MRGKAMASVAAAAFLAGCASIVTLGDDEIEVSTPGVTGAECELRTFTGAVRARVISPGTVELNKSSRDLEAVCNKDGYVEARQTIEAGFEPWVIGNLVFGGIPGFVIDIVAENTNAYNDVAIFMEPDPRGRRGRDDRDDWDDRRDDRRPMANSGGGGFDTTNSAVYLGFASAQSQADGTAEFMWLAESDLLGDARPVVQQRIDPGTGLPRFHIYGADVPRFDAEAICEGLEDRGYLCRVVSAQG